MNKHAFFSLQFPLLGDKTAILQAAEEIRQMEKCATELPEAREWSVVFFHSIKKEEDNVPARLKLAQQDTAPICEALLDRGYLGVGEVSRMPIRITRCCPTGGNPSTAIFVLTGAQLKKLQECEMKDNRTERIETHMKNKKKADKLSDAIDENTEAECSEETVTEKAALDRLISSIL